ncbi:MULTISPECIES: glycoside hydrolase family 88 protein [unclassified Paenibacillus]|uniref:glycoside hydrolase family 88 protein n=1 Tax=unclassified Paenibacillus TaxID=185978 RepID=UPI0030FB8C14
MLEITVSLRNEVIDRAVRQTRRQLDKLASMPSSGEIRLPYVTNNGRYMLEDKWSSGFFIGLLYQLYQLTGDTLYIEEADRWIGGIETYKNQGDYQDIGFLFYYSYAFGYDLTGKEAYRTIALEAADSLFDSRLPGGYLECNWLPEGKRYAGVDSMMNIRLWLWAYRITGEERYRAAAIESAQITSAALMREDGFTYEYMRMDSLTGAPEQPYNKNAKFSSASVWARGHTWALYGAVQMYVLGHEEEWRTKVEQLSAFYLAHVCSDGVPAWDLMLSHQETAMRDASAAAIACSAFYQFAAALSPDDPLRQQFRQEAERVLDVLISAEYAPPGPEHEGLLVHASTPLHVVQAAGESQIWGDYFLLEALYYSLEVGS